MNRQLLMLALTLTSFIHADVPPQPALPAQVHEASLDDVQQLLNEHKDAGILDVRTAEEVAEHGRMPGAKHLDLFREDFAAEVARLGLDPAKPCVVYCAIGGRAKRAARLLAGAGFKDIVLPSGGFNAWKMAGKPVEGGSR